MTDFNIFKDKLFAFAKERGFGDCEIFMKSRDGFSVSVFERSIREYKKSDEAGLSFRGVIDGKIGTAYTERVDETVIPFLVENAAQNALLVDDPDADEIYAGDSGFESIDLFNGELANIAPEAVIDAAFALESAALDYDERVKAADYCGADVISYETAIANTKGLDASYKGNMVMAYCVPRVEGADGQVKVDGEAWNGRDFGGLDPAKLGREGAETALSLLGAASYPSGTYNVVFTRDAMSSLLSAFWEVFSADEVQKGFSLLAGKIGEKVASDVVTLRDDPLLAEAPKARPFDDEGVKSANKAVVEGGILKTFLHNNKTAKKDGVKSTGNAVCGVKSGVIVAPTNLYIQNGTDSYDKVLEKAGDGLIVSSMQGLHSGTNASSGDFSLSATGFVIEGGKKGRAVEQVTVAGNFFALLNGITAVGDDLRWIGSPSQGFVTASPCVLVEKLKVAGE